MKIRRNIISNLAIVGAALALACSASRTQAQAITNLYINTFDTATQGAIGEEWGTGTITYDSANGNTPGAALVSVNFSGSTDTPSVAYICYGQYANPWYVQTPLDFSQFQTLQFDILWDNTSDITIGEFNDLSTWPDTLTNSASGTNSVFYSWANGGTALAAGGFTGGIDVILCGGPGGQLAPTLITMNLPTAASNGWAHVTIPINQAQAQIDGVSGIVFHKWCSDTWTLQTPVNARFWIDNVLLQGTTAPPPPPTVAVPTTAVEGLNVFASTSGLADRHEAMLVPNSGLSWVGTTGGPPTYPVSYSFTLNSFPNIPAYSGEAYMFMVPNPAAQESAPDWNETNLVIVEIQSTATGGQMIFQYKVNEAGGNNMQYDSAPNTNAPGSWPGAGTVALTNWFEEGNLTNVQSSKLLGTWTLQFSSAANGTLIAPDGTTASFTIPSYYVSNFQENGSTAAGFNIYLGMQANTAAALNQAVVYGSFAVSNVGGNFSETFVGETSLNTANWNPNYDANSKGVLVVPPAAPYWISWTLPATGFALTDSGSLAPDAFWSSVSTFAPISMASVDQQLISTNDLTSANGEFFRLVQRAVQPTAGLAAGRNQRAGHSQRQGWNTHCLQFEQ